MFRKRTILLLSLVASFAAALIVLVRQGDTVRPPRSAARQRDDLRLAGQPSIGGLLRWRGAGSSL